MPRPRRGFSPAFHRLWAAAAVTNLADGALLAAAPLLLATVTADPAAIAAAAGAQQVPWLLFALTSGALADRLPRRTVIAVANTVRAGIVGLLAIAVSLGTPALWLLYLVAFLLGTVETLVDAAYGALVADTVPDELLGRANARLFTTFSINNQLLGPPLGALLFTIGAAVPFGLHAIATLTAALVILRVPPGTRGQAGSSLRADVADGLRWLWRHPGLCVLAACIFVMNLAGGGVFALWVLYGKQHLGLTDTQYGLFIATGAIGCLTGAWTYGRLETRFGQATLLRAGLVVEAATYLTLAVAPSVWVAAATMAVFGVHAVVWGSVAVTARQRATPSTLLGRVGSAYQLASVTGTVLGVLLAGLLARRFGLLVPFWLAFLLVAVMTVLAWRRLAVVGAGAAR